jgi:hypothetical protein
MPTIAVLSLLAQIFCVVHAIKTGRDRIWIWVILIFSLVGCAAYFVVEILPEIQNSRAVRKFRKTVTNTVDPQRSVRELATRLKTSDNIKNKMELAKECTKQGWYEEAIDLYNSCLKGIYVNDPPIMLELAFTLFAKGDYQQTKATLNKLIAANPKFKSAEGHLLFARSLEALKEYEAAMEEYRVLISYYPGEEAKCRYALLLRNLGETEKARELFQQIVTSTQLAPNFYHRKEKEWVEIASQHLN